MYFRSSIIAASMMLFSSVAHAKTPEWVSSLTNHSEFEEIKQNERNEVACVALAIYYESRDQPLLGRQAVGNVVMNRTKSNKFPATACGVLFQPHQFSFIRKGKALKPKIAQQWQSAIRVAKSVMRGNVRAVNSNILSFCQRRLRKSGYVIDGHVFY